MDGEIAGIINRQRVEELLGDLIKIYSPFFHEDEIMEFVYGWFKEKNIPVDYHRFHEKKITDFQGTNLIGRLIGQEEGPAVILNGHLDTVEICEGWTRSPLTPGIEGDRMYGLGALDMKSGVTAIMLAVEVFKEHNPYFNGEILYSLVCDEEGPYGLGTDALIQEGFYKQTDVAVIPEPSSGFNAESGFPCLCLGARGGWKYTITLEGKSAHAASPQMGVNAINEAARLIGELEKSVSISHPKLGSGSICVIEINGGGAPLSVPDQASFSVFRHVTIGEDRKYLRDEVEKAAERAGIKAGISFHFRDAPHPDNAGFQPYVVSESNPYTKTIKQSIEQVTGVKPNIDYFSSVGDFNYLGSRVRIPTYVIGPDGDNYHGADEYVELNSVVKTAEIIYNFLKRILVQND